MASFDLFPVKVYGPTGGNNRQGFSNFARLFTHDGALYLAESPDRGRTVSQVTIYDMPEGEPTRPGNQAKWGNWSYNGCGCMNYWRRHTKESLINVAKDTRTVESGEVNVSSE